jgi:hypothetical protein
MWEASGSKVTWTGTLKCLKALPPQGGGGTVEIDGGSVDDGGGKKRIKCGQIAADSDTSRGEGSSIVKDDPNAKDATTEATRNTTEQCYLDANAAALGLRPPSLGSCRKRHITITLGTMSVDQPVKQSIPMPSSGPGGVKKNIEGWLVTARCKWTVQVTFSA